MQERIVKAYNEAVFDTDWERALKVVRQALDQGVSPEDVMLKVIIPAIEMMIESVSERSDANLAQHFLTAQIVAEATEEMIAIPKDLPEVLGPRRHRHLNGRLSWARKTDCYGMFESYMIDVTDLGLKVPPERFVGEAVAHNSDHRGQGVVLWGHQ